MQKPERHIFRLFVGTVGFVSWLAFDASAQSYPAKPIRIVVGYVPGGAVDFTARLVARNLSESLGQPVVVENRPGSSTAIATEKVATSPADGYTLGMVTSSGVVQSALRTNVPYDLERDFAPVSLVATGTFVLVAWPSVPARNVKELIALAQSQPGKLNYGSPGVGSSLHLADELFKLMAKVNVVHVPYRGAAEAVIATAAGQVALSFSSVAGALSLLEAGKLRPLAVTSIKRTSLMPAIPTLDESGVPGYDRTGWYGVLAPAGVRKDIIARLNGVIGTAAHTPEVRASLRKEGFEPQTNTPEQFAALIHGELAKIAKLIELTGLKAE
jgi:tripartite-type tricarboxylate transporter receptor subunit TctC